MQNLFVVNPVVHESLNEWQYDRVVADIHATSLDSSRWDVLIRRLADRLSAQSALFGIRDISTHQWNSLSLVAGDEAIRERVQGYDWDIFATIPVGYWDIYYDTGESNHVLLAARVYEDNERYGLMAFYFCAVDLERVRALVASVSRLSAHLELACRMMNEVAKLKLQAAVARLALDRLIRPLWIVESDGSIQFSNDSAQQLSGRYGVTVSGGRLNIGNTVQRERFRSLLMQSVQLGAPSAGMSLGEQDHALKITLVPLPPDSPLSGTVKRPLVLVMALSPEFEESLPIELLAALYGLSPAETRLALRLLTGDTIAEAAGNLGVRISTARTQLKFIFWKTGTRRQAELIKLLASAAPIWS